MTPLERLISRFQVNLLIRCAILCTLSSLAIMVIMTFWPIALLVVLGMGAAQVLGIAGVVLFGASVLREVMSPPARSSTTAVSPSTDADESTRGPGPA